MRQLTCVLQIERLIKIFACVLWLSFGQLDEFCRRASGHSGSNSWIGALGCCLWVGALGPSLTPADCKRYISQRCLIHVSCNNVKPRSPITRYSCTLLRQSTTQIIAGFSIWTQTSFTLDMYMQPMIVYDAICLQSFHVRITAERCGSDLLK